MKILDTYLIKEDYFFFPALSKSFLSAFSISPAHAFLRSYSKAMDFGSAMHEFILEPEKFGEKYHIRPKHIDLRKKKDPEVIEFKKASAGKEILTADDYETIDQLKVNFLNFPFYFPEEMTMKEVLENSIIEQGFGATVDIDGIEISLKCKPDFVYERKDEVFIFDLKSVDKANIGLFHKNAKYLKYNWQSELYKYILEGYFKKTCHFIFVLCEKNRPYGIRYVEIQSDCMDDIEETILGVHSWELNGGDRCQIYYPNVEEVFI